MAANTQHELVLSSPTYPLSGQITEAWRLVRPISLDIKIGEAAEYIVSYPHFETYGVGDTLQEAVADFSSMLIDLYEELSDSEETLSTYLKDLLERLRLALSPL
jgi:hypothetical protein